MWELEGECLPKARVSDVSLVYYSYMDGVLRELDTRVMGKGVSLDHKGLEWEINNCCM